MWTETQRAALADAFDRTLGAGPAAMVMAEFDKLARGDLATRADVHGEVAGLRAEMHREFGLVRGEIGELRGEMGELRGEMGELRGQMGELRGQMGELRGEIGELRGEIGELRGHIVGIDGRLNGLVGRQVLANVPIMFGTAALVLAAVKLG